MYEGRKPVIGIMASILVARYLKNDAELMGYFATPRTESQLLTRGAFKLESGRIPLRTCPHQYRHRAILPSFGTDINYLE
jgi:hypothetical protein